MRDGGALAVLGEGQDAELGEGVNEGEDVVCGAGTGPNSCDEVHLPGVPGAGW